MCCNCKVLFSGGGDMCLFVCVCGGGGGVRFFRGFPLYSSFSCLFVVGVFS